MQFQRLPVTAIIATLIAFAALYLAPGGFFLGPILALALLATYTIDARLELKSPLTQIIRFILFGIVLVPAFGRYAADNGDPVELILAHAFGELAACELVLQAWLKRPVGGQRGAISVFLSSFALMGASNTFDTNYIRFLVPAYMLFLILSLREFHTPLSSTAHSLALPDIKPYQPNGRVRSWSWLALLVAILSGATFHFGVLYYRNQINDIGMKLLSDREPPQTSGISTTPTLGDTFGATGSLTRMLRIEGFSGQPYLRAMAFDHYAHGSWGPGVTARGYLPITRQQIGDEVRGHHMTISRLVDDNQLVFTPLNAAGIVAPPHTELEWAPAEGGPLRSIEPVPYPFIYDVILDPDAAHQGPLCAPPMPEQRQKYLEVAKEINPQVHELARRIGEGLSTPIEQVEAVQEYLMTHHAYSLSTQAGQGDPISNFLLQRKAAHCEYFASAATILLRCLGVPTRYVIGYYVHETDGPNTAIVRGRDAHAWAESWVEGIGWVTVDATPGGGRPDQTTQPLPFSIKLREHLQDYLALLRDKLTHLTRTQQAIILGLCVLILMLRSWQRQGPKTRSTDAAFSYTLSDAELAALATRFEQVLRKQGAPCPPHRTWQEHIQGLHKADSESQLLNANDLRAFLRGYNQLRFGHHENGVTRGKLEDLLTTLENVAPPHTAHQKSQAGKETS